jgi:putative pyruvate formate lyase activating enzyme
LAQVSSFCRHMGEEPPISGRRGSGTIFFTHCNLRCVFCQNHQISQAGRDAGDACPPERLADIMLELQSLGCHNINLVSPTHFTPQWVRALDRAASLGLRLPIVYNSNGYDSPEVLRLLDGIVDLYLPDLKYADPAAGLAYSGVREYPVHARAAIAEMWRQVGPLRLDADGIARRGMVVRHLVLPNELADSRDSLDWLAQTCGPEVPVSLMAQYWPTHQASQHPLLARRITRREYQRVLDHAIGLGFSHLLAQDPGDAPDSYCPDFSRPHPFEG